MKNIIWSDGKSTAQAFNYLGTHNIVELNKFMGEFWIVWGNESDEWQKAFVLNASPDIMQFIINHNK